MFLREAGTVILALSVILWALSTYPKSPEGTPAPVALEQSGNTAAAAAEYRRLLQTEPDNFATPCRTAPRSRSPRWSPRSRWSRAWPS